MSVVETHVGCSRALNEDAVLASPANRLWAVADGMGGHEAGEVASAMVVEALSGCAGLKEALAALDSVNARLVEMGRAGSAPRTIGSTVVGIVASPDDRFTCFWAGDSRAYRLRGGKLTRLTRDHSLVQDLVDGGMLSEAEAEGHPNANIITRAVGVADRLDVETVSGDVRCGDVFLLASDGLTRLVSDDELLAHLALSDDAAKQLLQLTLDGGAPDNVSLIVVRATDSPAREQATVLKHGLQPQ